MARKLCLSSNDYIGEFLIWKRENPKFTFRLLPCVALQRTPNGRVAIAYREKHELKKTFVQIYNLISGNDVKHRPEWAIQLCLDLHGFRRAQALILGRPFVEEAYRYYYPPLTNQHLTEA